MSYGICLLLGVFGRNLEESKPGKTQCAPAFFFIIDGVQFAYCRNGEMVLTFHLEAEVYLFVFEGRKSSLPDFFVCFEYHLLTYYVYMSACICTL